ncbi:hypothetical protein [Actinoplanes sp. NPDC051494]|uniref:hypothetical protein n=1 Tax=Actinoplanes sp. NPDC051494 TaxID=3363907 RepID=UPI0037AEE135
MPTEIVRTFESATKAWLILLADHDDNDVDFNVYYELYRIVGFEPDSSEKRTKPPCCGDDGSAPAMGQLAEDLALRAIPVRRTRR